MSLARLIALASVLVSLSLAAPAHAEDGVKTFALDAGAGLGAGARLFAGLEIGVLPLGGDHALGLLCVGLVAQLDVARLRLAWSEEIAAPSLADVASRVALGLRLADGPELAVAARFGAAQASSELALALPF